MSFVILILTFLLLKTLSIITDKFYIDFIVTDFIILTLLTIIVNITKLNINPWLVNLGLLIIMTIIIKNKSIIRLNYKRYIDFIVTVVISLLIIFIQYRYFDGVDINLFPSIRNNFTTVINFFYYGKLPFNFLFSSIFTSLIPLGSVNSVEIINTYCFIANLTFFFTISALVVKIYQCKSTEYTLIALLLSLTYLISPAGLVYNYLDLIWMLIPTTLLTLNNVDRYSIIYVLFSTLISLPATIVILAFTVIKRLLDSRKCIIGFILALIIIFTVCITSTTRISPMSLLMAAKSNEMLPMFYLNRKTIVITAGFIFIYSFNSISKIKSSQKLTINFSKLSFLLIVLVTLLSGDTLLFTCVSYVFLNPQTFVDEFNNLSSGILSDYMNVTNVPICCILLFMWVISHAFSFNPYGLTNRALNNIYLDQQVENMYQFINDKYGYDISIKSNLLSTSCYFINSNTSNSQQLLIHNKDNELFNNDNYVEITTFDNFTLYKYIN